MEGGASAISWPQVIAPQGPHRRRYIEGKTPLVMRRFLPLRPNRRPLTQRPSPALGQEISQHGAQGPRKRVLTPFFPDFFPDSAFLLRDCFCLSEQENRKPVTRYELQAF